MRIYRKHYKEFGETIRALRKSIRLKRQQLADKIGVSKCTLAQWERGERFPSADNLFELAEALGVPASEMFGDTYDKISPAIFNHDFIKAQEIFGAMFNSPDSDENLAQVTCLDGDKITFSFPHLSNAEFPTLISQVYCTDRKSFINLIDGAVLAAAKSGSSIANEFLKNFRK